VAGKAMLEHTHDGNELTLVLQGSISDEVGDFGVGNIADLDKEIVHQPIVDSTDHCICLIATDAPFKFINLLGKIDQPITGF
jgi:putative transcriptional regulator